MATEYYLLTIAGTVDHSEQTTSLVFRTDDATANDTLNNGKDLIAAWEADVETAWLDFNGQDYEVRRMTARRLNPTGSAVAHTEYPRGAKPGNVTDDIAALNLAPAIRIIPGTLGATGGRCFLPSPFKTGINNNTYDSAYVGLVTTCLDILLAPISSSFDWQWQVWHRKSNTFSTAVAYNLSPRFGFQGRRRFPIG